VTAEALDLYGGKDPREVPAYTFRELALSLRMPESTLRAWTVGQKGFEPLLFIPRDPRGVFELSFYNLIEIYVLAQLRGVHDLSMPKVRRCIEVLQGGLQAQHPIIEAEFYILGQNVYAKYGLHTVNLTRPEGQTLFADVMRDLLTRVDKGPFGFSRFYPKLPNKVGVVTERYKPIVVDPEVTFGRPRIAGTGIPTEVIADRYRAGESMNAIAEDVYTSVTKVRHALEFEKVEIRSKAA
jgi:uncharacterized protein (DUF433 family)